MDGHSSEDKTSTSTYELVLEAVKAGDVAAVEEFVEQGFAVESSGADGYTLLHWAALYDRANIVNYLILKNKDVDAVSGGNMETALQLALRANCCSLAVMHPLIAESRSLQNKDAQGQDALSIAVQNFSLAVTFMLLDAGADPDAVDACGDTPLYWLLRQAHSDVSLELQRLLLRFNASVTHQASRDGSNALHLIAQAGEESHAASALLVFLAGCKDLRSEELLLTSTNLQSLTPAHAAQHVLNPRMGKFVSDALMYKHCPRWLPTLSTALVGCGVFACLHWGGWLYGLPACAPLYVVGKWLEQASLRAGHSRPQCGMAWAIAVSTIGCYFLTIAHTCSAAFNTLAATVSALSLYTFVQACITIPLHLKPAAPGQQLEHLAEKYLQAEKQGRRFRLCTTCLVDRALASTHCSECDRCVVGVDHHCLFVDNCVGRGNRRVFVCFLLCAFLGCLLFTAAALSTTQSHFCKDAASESVSAPCTPAPLHPVPLSLLKLTPSAILLCSRSVDSAPAGHAVLRGAAPPLALRADPEHHRDWGAGRGAPVRPAETHSGRDHCARHAEERLPRSGPVHQQGPAQPHSLLPAGHLQRSAARGAAAGEAQGAGRQRRARAEPEPAARTQRPLPRPAREMRKGRGEEGREGNGSGVTLSIVFPLVF
ncbi:ankyrin repeat-containing domain protein [Ochromonadaceae sp. CCMP2298]|nr:ankyrin repeat-containing domain protein [Ochromonadaceae sp. CCMP2298]